MSNLLNSQAICAIALTTRSHTMLDLRFSIKELGMSEEAQGLEHGRTVAFFLEVSNTEQLPANLLNLKVWEKLLEYL
ncbi:hypothetical protein [Microcoleus sp. herbarium2]|uniref:hypothetical protein n=1 Tax=Microcoleus sp. herbarium2 TaxID=3055433 RepID=UPI002FD604F4